MAVDEHLQPSEEIRARFRHVVATDRHLARYEPGASRQFTVIDYDRIAAVHHESHGSPLLLINALLLLVIGMAGITFFQVLGLVMVVAGLLYRHGVLAVEREDGTVATVARYRYLRWIWTAPRDEAESFAAFLPVNEEAEAVAVEPDMEEEDGEKRNMTYISYGDRTYTYCEACGAGVDPEASFCSSCGADLEASS